MVHPCENQKVPCPLLHSVVPLVQDATLGSKVPVGGCLPLLQAGRVESMEFLVGGMIIDAWPWAIPSSMPARQALRKADSISVI